MTGHSLDFGWWRTTTPRARQENSHGDCIVGCRFAAAQGDPKMTH
jgi:hypothetical protein